MAEPTLEQMLTYLATKGRVELIYMARYGHWECGLYDLGTSGDVNSFGPLSAPLAAVRQVYDTVVAEAKAKSDEQFAAFLARGGTDD